MSAAELTSPAHDVADRYADNHPWLFGWLRRRLDNAAEAADLVHDTFVRLIASTSASGSGSVVRAGQQARFSQDSIAASEDADIGHEAWTRGTLAADNITLREVIRELGRYREGHLEVADDIAHLTVYGNFPIQGTDLVLRMLAGALPIRIEQPRPGWTRVQARRHGT